MKKRFTYLLTLLAIVSFISCDESVSDVKIPNQAPETSLFLYTDTGISQQPSKIEVNWWGDDPDGIVVGFYYKWNGNEWKFTTENKIAFALQIGASDTLYGFKVASADNDGNGKYDTEIVQNGISFGSEPFADGNNNGVFDEGEDFIDIGLVDPTPAEQDFPIKNSRPTIEWNQLTSLPLKSFPVMTFGWNADDLDGIESIQKINVALNDSANIISLDGATRNITIRIADLSSSSTDMDILVNGNVIDQKLSGLKLDADNRIYVQVEDISGAKSKFITLPDEDRNWFVIKPKGKLLVLDDNTKADNSAEFYATNLNLLDNGNLNGNYDVWDLNEEEIPYRSITFIETIKLFGGLLWYSDTQPDIELASSSLKKYTDDGGKVLFTSVLPHPVDLRQLQDFLPIDDVSSPIKVLGTNKVLSVSSDFSDYPELLTTGSSIKVKTFYPQSAAAKAVYTIPDDITDESDVISFKSNDGKVFFFGLPLHECDGNEGNVKVLLEKILIEDFGLGL
ncbi:MAG: hypothetical protein JEY94_00200 [Melioribacteraceae bacterium]|nr:hypothetical protein [Melioribacteraceae bacterium]